MRTKKALYNSVTSVMLQIVTAICGFILPRFFLQRFGSEVNGAISSISQFLGYISLLEAGVGGVTRAALYKPLADGNAEQISGIVNATQSFFKKLSLVFVIYVVVLSFTYKFISNTGLDMWYVATLVVILSISTFAQYFFGASYSVLLHADQRNYIATSIQIATVILNTIVSIILLKAGCEVHVVKLVSVSVYVIRPLILSHIAKKQFSISKAIPPDNTAIKQRWSGFGHHIAFYIHNNVDMMVITIMLSLKDASVYSVYYMIVTGMKNIVIALTGGTEAAFGNIIAKKQQDILKSRFHVTETISSMAIIVFFATTGGLLIDFVKLYTHGISDVNYIVPVFGILFVVSDALHCIKQTYHSLTLAAGHYKQTQVSVFIEAGVNLVLSILLASVWGITGVLVATIISTVYRIISLVIHLKKNILYRNMWVFIKRQLINILNVAILVVLICVIPFGPINDYWSWIVKAFVVFGTAFIVTLLCNLLFYRQDVFFIFRKIKTVLKKAG